MSGLQDLALNDLDILQHGGGVLHSIQFKREIKRHIIKANRTGCTLAPLRLTTQEHLNSRPRLWLNLESLRLRWLAYVDPKGCSIIGGLVNDPALKPVTRSLDQFFAFLPVTLSK